jgi:hypothetical protein
MRRLSIILGFLVAILVSACDLWPNELEPLAESISRQVSGDTTTWLLGGDVVVIDVAGSPSYQMPQSELEVLAAGIAEQAIAYSASRLESIVITFYEVQVSDDPDKMREFIFLVMKDRPVLQPYLSPNATGPLTDEEIQAAIERMGQSYDQLGKSLTEEHRECVLGELQRRARDVGDPETLDLATVDFLTSEAWYLLDASGKRIFLAQAIMTEASFSCAGPRKAETSSGK